MRWLWWYIGPDFMSYGGLRLTLRVMMRRDLMKPHEQLMEAFALLAVDVVFGRSDYDFFNGNLVWRVSARWRSDINKITRRLAGGDE